MAVTVAEIEHCWVTCTPLDLRTHDEDARQLGPPALRHFLLDHELRPGPRGLTVMGATLDAPLHLSQCNIRTSLRRHLFTARNYIDLSGVEIGGQLSMKVTQLTSHDTAGRGLTTMTWPRPWGRPLRNVCGVPSSACVKVSKFRGL